MERRHLHDQEVLCNKRKEKYTTQINDSHQNNIEAESRHIGFFQIRRMLK